MGYSCSCFHSKTGESAHLLPPASEDPSKSNVIMNDEYIKACQMKSSCGNQSNYTSMVTMNKEPVSATKRKLLDDPKAIDFFEKSIKFCKRHYMLNLFRTKLKNKLEHESELLYAGFVGLSKNYQVSKAELSNPFDKNGWKKLYPSWQEFICDERIFPKRLLFSYEPRGLPKDTDDLKVILRKSISAYQGNLKNIKRKFDFIIGKPPRAARPAY